MLLVTDGGADPHIGSFGWIIATKNGERLDRGCGLASGIDPRSFRSETHGGRCGILFIQLTFKYTEFDPPMGRLQLHADNEGMIKKLRYMSEFCLAADTALNGTF